MKYILGFIVITFIISAAFPSSSFARTRSPIHQREETEKSHTSEPKTFKEAELMKKKFLTQLPIVLKVAGQKTLIAWKGMFNLTKTFWNFKIKPWILKIWNKTLSFLGKEAEEKEPKIKKEFQKEKQEMREDIPKIGKSIWQRFISLLR